MASLFCRVLSAVAFLTTLAIAFGPLSAIADEPQEVPIEPTTAKAELAPKEEAIEQLFERARPSIAVITTEGRDGRKQGLGSGFVIAADGLIATNMHVIGEGRPIAVQLADGKRLTVNGVHASDQFLDLAILRVDAQDLKPLPLGDSAALREGQSMVALGNPLGLKHSVVAGLVSGRRDIEGRSMIQLAIPLEPGNSGGPLLDRQGRVCGILTMKSAVTANLGFAVGINELKALLTRPNPLPIANWVKLGSLDPREWQAVLGGNWRKRAGRITVSGEGEGFGGRALCLSMADAPKLPYEMAVDVRLDDEAGAAGLVFGSDGGERHYGFYPTAGSLRLTRFDGPDVLNWKILAQRPATHYLKGEWNQLKVRVEEGRVLCYVNGHLVETQAVDQPPTGRVGLAKFRDTRAEFKHFQVADKIVAPQLSPAVAGHIEKFLTEVSTPAGPRKELPLELIAQLAPESPTSAVALVEKAQQLEQQAERLRRLATAVRQTQVRSELARLFAEPEERVDLWSAALWLARLDNDEVDVDAYRRQLDRMATEISASVEKDAPESARLAGLDKFFFKESGFHGSRRDYGNRSNSYVNEVLDDREGLPITLSLIYMELGKRLGLQIEGVGLPGHFVVRFRPADGEARLIDVFEGGHAITPDEAEKRVRETTGAPPTEAQLQPMTKRAILVRMLHNLLSAARSGSDEGAMLRYLDALLTISPDAHQERWLRGIARWRSGDRRGAKDDADWLLKAETDLIDREQLQDFRAMLERTEE